jgi:hypothetical protein
MLCGIDPTGLALNFSVPAQPELDHVGFGIGLQLGSYYSEGSVSADVPTDRLSAS